MRAAGLMQRVLFSLGEEKLENNQELVGVFIGDATWFAIEVDATRLFIIVFMHIHDLFICAADSAASTDVSMTTM